MSKAVVSLVAVIVALCALNSAGPIIVALAQALVPLVVALGSVVVALRTVWYLTGRS